MVRKVLNYDKNILEVILNLQEKDSKNLRNEIFLKFGVTSRLAIFPNGYLDDEAILIIDKHLDEDWKEAWEWLTEKLSIDDLTLIIKGMIL